MTKEMLSFFQLKNLSILHGQVFIMSAYILGDLYTLMMVDANTANPVVGNATHPLLYWLVTNIKDGMVSNGNSPLWNTREYSYLMIRNH